MYYYVYRITNKKEGKHYYGKRKSNLAPKNDLGVRYFSSSTDKEFMADQKQNPDVYKYKVVKVFTEALLAAEFEIRLHTKFEVGSNPAFYNKAKQTSSKFDASSLPISKERREAISKMFKGRKLSEEHKEKIRQSKKYVSEETKIAIGNAHRGKLVSKETRDKLRAKAVGRVMSAAAKEKITKATQGANNPRAKLINVFDYTTGKLIAANVVCALWCKDKGYSSGTLMQTLKRDITKPHCTNSRKAHKSRYNVLHYKGLYVELVHSSDLLPK